MVPRQSPWAPLRQATNPVWVKACPHSECGQAEIGCDNAAELDWPNARASSPLTSGVSRDPVHDQDPGGRTGRDSGDRLPGIVLRPCADALTGRRAMSSTILGASRVVCRDKTPMVHKVPARRAVRSVKWSQGARALICLNSAAHRDDEQDWSVSSQTRLSAHTRRPPACERPRGDPMPPLALPSA
jgi:hypothetical protein